MKKKTLLPILLLAAMTITACTPANSSKTESKPVESSVPTDVSSDEPISSEETPISSEDPVQYGVKIANKAALQGEWYADTTRDLDIELTPAANALQELNKKTLTVTSSNAEVVAVTGLGLKGLKAGTATITVKYHDATDTVEVTIIDNSAKAKYGVAHEGTAADPFTNEDALVVAKHEKYEGEVYYVKGKVASFYNAPGSRDDGMVAYYLEPATAGGEKFEIYKCFKEKGVALTDDDIWVGGVATAYGAFTKYNNQYETSSATFVSCEGTKPEPSKTVTATFAEALAIGAALDDGANTWDSYKFQGYVTLRSGTDYYLTATKGETLTKSKSDEAHGSRDVYATAIELYGAGKVEALVAKLLEGAKVEVTMKLKNYHGQVENLANLADADVTVIEAGTAWSVPEPKVEDKTLAEFIALPDSKAKAYNVKATIKSWKDATSAKDQYGNMVLTDGTNDLVIYGASATATALAWDNAGAYAFTNPKDFLTNEVTAALQVGSEITMKLIRADYKGTVQGTGVITAVTAVEATGISLDKETAEVEVGETVKLSATLAPAGATSTVTWTSSDEKVATVAAGVVTGVKAGTAKITAKVSDTIKAECTVTVKEAAAQIKDLPADGLKIDATSLDLATNTSYASNNNRKVTIGDFDIVLDPDSAGTVMKASSPYTASAAVGADCMQIKKGNLNVFTFKTKIKAAKLLTATMYTNGYATEGKDYLPYILVGSSTTPIIANEVQATDPVAGVDTGKLNGDKKIYRYVLTYNISALAEETLTFVSAKSAATYFSDIVISNTAPQPEIAQPTGTFFAPAEITDAGKTALGTTSGIVPIFITLGAENAVSLSINGNAVPATFKSYDKATGNLVITTTAYGDISMTYNPETKDLEKLSVVAATGVLKYDGGQSLKGNEKLKYWNCDGTTEQLQAEWNRRYGDPWTLDNNNADRVTQNTEHFKSGSAMRLRPYADNRFSLATKDFAQPFNARNISFWVYNSGSADATIQCFGYKQTNYGTSGMVQPFGNKTIKAGEWTFVSAGFTASDLYGFQIFVAKTASALIFDDICLF